MSKLNATETLRQLLNERGVKWYARNILSTAYVHWGNDRKGPTFDAKDAGGGKVDLFCYRISPEQAVEATLGKGICKVEQHGSLANWSDMVCWSCSECGFGWHHSINDKQFTYCPNCGRKIES